MADLELKVTDIKDLTSNIKMFEFVSANGEDLPPFDAGAHIDVETGSGLRSYSLANDPKVTDRYVTAVLKEGAGKGGSRWMHETLKVGDIVKSSKPIQNFPLEEKAEKSLLLAGGIGITPILAMSHRLKDLDANFQVFYCTRSEEETAFREELKELIGDRITFVHDGGDPSKGLNLRDTFGNRKDNAHLYVCGPAGLLRAVREVTSHWPENAVHFELFSSTRSEEELAAATSGETEEFEVELAQSGVTLTIPADRSILDVLLDEGYGVPYACEEGWCGACTIGVVSGKVDHRDEFLSDSEKEENKKMQVCISRAAPGEKLVLDL